MSVCVSVSLLAFSLYLSAQLSTLFDALTLQLHVSSKLFAPRVLAIELYIHDWFNVAVEFQ